MGDFVCALQHTLLTISRLTLVKKKQKTKQKHTYQIQIQIQIHNTVVYYVAGVPEYQSLIDPVLLFTFTHSYTEALPH